MRAGRLRHQVAIQTATTAQDAYGQPVKTWATTATVWGAVEPIGGKEAYRAQAERADLSHLVVIRYRSGVTPMTRILFGTRTMDIESVVDPEERHRELHLLCREVVA